ncbi:hypothetical protein PTSG_12873 [Salpingoeca rosetta]|uniref:Integrase catalytic domain-containing protein n=1 Tax=Salpingoeca rosetta (strain ATCC 50818 / BSB-021) TaxID=946362 RepID=F2UMC3_SALR5|nr:uncharacterized protein PTSG_12873 [Salpingoeca rosetta]EGD78272.1 hypothetical protein PTSG_12873 [Salpingoeca rosetta]|eukprot:XP_004989595.1 hypothetical protein PTSG_12873 [Salpingoeca rosetta]
MNLQQIMRPSTISADGIKVFAGAEQDANLFFITVEAKLIAAGIDAGIIAEGGADHQGDRQAPAAASSPSPSTHGASGPRTRSRAQRGPRRTGARHDAEDHDDDDDDEGDGDDHGAQPSSSSSSLPSSATPSGGAQVASRASGLMDPRDPQVDAAIFAFLLGVLTGHPLRLAITDNRGRSGVLALRRLRERYIRSGKDHLLAAGVSIPEDDLRTLVRNELPAEFDVAMRFMEREDPPPSLSKMTADLIQEERRLHRPKKRTPVLAIGGPGPSSFAASPMHAGTSPSDTSGGPCCPPAERVTCAFCNFRGHCAQQCRKLQAAKRYHVIDVRQILATLRNHGNGNGKRPGSSRPQHGRAAPFKKAAVVSHGPQRVETFAIHHDALMLQPEGEEEGHAIGPVPPQVWLADSGATAHITSDASLLTNYVAVTQHVTVANNQTVTVIGKGDCVLRVTGTDGAPGTITLKNVLHVPDIKYNLLALNLVTRARRGASVVIAADDSRIQFATWSVPLLPSKDTGHLFLYASTTTSQQATALAGELVHSSDGEAEDADEDASAHDVLGHRSSAAVDAIRQQIAQASSKHIVTCGPCALGKSTRASIPKQSAPRSAGPCQLLYADIAGPLEETSLRGARYALTFIDDCTRFAWTFLIRHKNDVGAALEQLRKDRHVINALRGATLQTDSDAVFKSQDFTDLCLAFDIKQRFSPPHSQAKNGSAERTFRTLFETARTMLFAADLDKPFWGFAVQHATLLHNIAPRRSLKDKSPFEALTGHPFDVSLLRVFGSPAYVHVEKSSTRHKLDPRSRVGVYVGFAEEDQAHVVWMPDTRRVVHTIHARFGASAIKNKDVASSQQQQEQDNSGASASHANKTAQRSTEDSATGAPTAPRAGEPQLQPRALGGSVWDQLLVSETLGDKDTSGGSTTTCHVATSAAGTGEKTSAVGGHLPDIAVGSVATSAEPATVKEALASPDSEEWRQAILDEFAAMQANDVYDVVPRADLPKGHKLLRSMVIFRRKRDDQGKVIKYKARWVAKGYSQVHGVNYTDTFAPTATIAAIRTMLAMAVARGMDIQQMDVNTAFLNAARGSRDLRPATGRRRHLLAEYGPAPQARAVWAETKFVG